MSLACGVWKLWLCESPSAQHPEWCEATAGSTGENTRLPDSAPGNPSRLGTGSGRDRDPDVEAHRYTGGREEGGEVGLREEEGRGKHVA